jgi:hypothetical protein
VVLVEGPRFAPGVRRRLSSPRTTLPLEPLRREILTSRLAFLIYGLLLALPLVWMIKPHWIQGDAGQRFDFGVVREPRIWRVAGEINAALDSARPGDTVLVAPGTYNEQIRLRDGVRLISERPRQAVIRANAIAISGEDLRSGRVEGFRIQPDDNIYLQVGIQLAGSSVEIVDNEISGTVTAGIDLQNSPGSVVRANTVRARSRAAVMVRGEGEGPRLTGNYLISDGHPAVVVTGAAKPAMTGNAIRAVEPLFLPPGANAAELLAANVVLPPEGKEKRPAPRRNAPARIR